jgi:hypothetical protein
MKNFFKILIIFSLFFVIFPLKAISSPKNSDLKTKFYNFDDLLINGQYRKPQVLYIDAREKLRFERLLKLKKDLLPRLKKTQKDPSLR